MRVLVFDDDIIRHKVFELRLSSDDVCYALTAHEAILALTDKVFDLIYLENSVETEDVATFIISLPVKSLPNQVIVRYALDIDCDKVYTIIREANIAVSKEMFDYHSLEED
jgi:hypothetical protein